MLNIVTKDDTLERQMEDLHLLDIDIKQTNQIASNWQPNAKVPSDQTKQETAYMFQDMNSKLREKVGDLIQNIELVIKKNEQIEKAQNGG